MDPGVQTYLDAMAAENRPLFDGWTAPGAVSLLERHPELSSGKGTLRIPLTLAEDISDAELLEVIQGSLSD